VDQGKDLDRVSLAATIDESHVGGDANPVVAGQAFERQRAQRAVAPVAREQRNLVERGALHAAVPALDRVVELAGEDGDEEGGGFLGTREIFLGRRGRSSGRRSGGALFGVVKLRPEPVALFLRRTQLLGTRAGF